MTRSVKMFFRKNFMDAFSIIKDLSTILSWWETWVPVLVALAIIGFWSSYAFALTLPNPWKSLIIWGMILTLVTLIPGYSFLSGRQKD